MQVPEQRISDERLDEILASPCRRRAVQIATLAMVNLTLGAVAIAAVILLG